MFGTYEQVQQSRLDIERTLRASMVCVETRSRQETVGLGHDWEGIETYTENSSSNYIEFGQQQVN
jgi:hypothetical protein